MKKLNVLYLDDDQDEIFLFKRTIQHIDYVEFFGFTFETDLYTQINEMVENNKKFMVFLDLNMGLVSGFEILLKIKNNPKSALAPIIVFSNSTHPADVEKALSLGASSYMAKPGSLDDGREKLTQILNTYQNVLLLPNQ